MQFIDKVKIVSGIREITFEITLFNPVTNKYYNNITLVSSYPIDTDNYRLKMEAFDDSVMTFIMYIHQDQYILFNEDQTECYFAI